MSVNIVWVDSQKYAYKGFKIYYKSACWKHVNWKSSLLVEELHIIKAHQNFGLHIYIYK